MRYWVKISFDYSGDPNLGHLQMVEVNHYYCERDDGKYIHVNPDKSLINLLDVCPSDEVMKEITREQFTEILKSTIEDIGINITNHKFI